MSNIWNMVFPNRCIFCGSLMPVKEHAICCGRCRNTLPIIRGDVCFKCGHEKEFCECLEANNTYDAVVAPFYFHGKVRSAIHAFKFNMRTANAEPLARAMACCAARHYRSISFDFITCVPMTKRKLRKRGFSQTRMLAEELSGLTGIRFEPDVLKKKFDTSDQHEIGYEERLSNLDNAYYVDNRDIVKDKVILLCDDVKTTGVTLYECACELRRAGARRIYAICAAITPNKRWRYNHFKEIRLEGEAI